MRLAIAVIIACVSMAPSARALTMSFAGDYGSDANAKTVLARINATAPDFHLALGDLSYDQIDEKSWCSMVKERVAQPFLLLPGNHESNDDDGDIAKFKNCLPYRYSAALQGEYPVQYYFDAPGEKYGLAGPVARFIMISPNLTFAGGRHLEYFRGNPNMQWLEEAVKDARVRQIPWVVVAMHKVCITTEAKPCEIGPDLMNALIDLKVDVVMSGHVHAYERTHALTCATPGLFDQKCAVVSAENRYAQGAGTLFLTVGTGGTYLRELNELDAEKGYFAVRFGKKENYRGIGRLEITQKAISHAFIESESGRALDGFQIVK